MIPIKCPACAQRAPAEEEWYSKRVVCQNCGHEFACATSLANVDNQPISTANWVTWSLLIFALMVVIAGIEQSSAAAGHRRVFRASLIALFPWKKSSKAGGCHPDSPMLGASRRG